MHDDDTGHADRATDHLIFVVNIRWSLLRVHILRRLNQTSQSPQSTVTYWTWTLHCALCKHCSSTWTIELNRGQMRKGKIPLPSWINHTIQWHQPLLHTGWSKSRMIIWRIFGISSLCQRCTSSWRNENSWFSSDLAFKRFHNKTSVNVTGLLMQFF